MTRLVKHTWQLWVLARSDRMPNWQNLIGLSLGPSDEFTRGGLAAPAVVFNLRLRSPQSVHPIWHPTESEGAKKEKGKWKGKSEHLVTWQFLFGGSPCTVASSDWLEWRLPVLPNPTDPPACQVARKNFCLHTGHYPLWRSVERNLYFFFN